MKFNNIVLILFILVVEVICQDGLIANTRILDFEGQKMNIFEGLLYQIRNPPKNKYLSLYGHTAPGTSQVDGNPDDYKGTKYEGQSYFFFNPVGDNLYQIINPPQNKYISLFGHASETTSALDANPNDYAGTKYEGQNYWRFVPVGKDNLYQIQNPPINKYISFQAHTADGTSHVDGNPNDYKGTEYEGQTFFEFIPVQYNIQADIYNFTYENPLQYLKKSQRPVSLMANMVFPNDSGATLTQKISETRKVQNMYTWGFKESASLKFSNSFTVGVNADASFLGTGVGASASNTFTWEVDLGFEANQQKTITETKIFDIQQQITIPPYSKIQASVVVNWINNAKIPFKAQLKLTGFADRVGNDFTIVKNQQVGVEVLKELLVREEYQYDSTHVIEEQADSIILEVSGEFICDAGFDTVFSTQTIN